MVVTLDCGGGLLGLTHCQQVVNGFLDGPGFRNGVCEMKRNGFQNDTKLVWSRKMKQQQEPTRGVRQRKRPAGKQRIQAVAAAYPPIAKTEKTFRLPIDYYQILGADMHHLADAVVRGFEARVNNPPREGFSQQALLARLEILRGARDTLADPELRADYNQALVEDEAGTLVLDVPWTKVGGALCLLHEVREVEVVLQAGQALLGQQQDLPKMLHRDVVLAMALSYVELSREAMAESPPAVVKSCSLLESALKLLQEEGGKMLAPDLQEQIEGTLEELGARCVLELLALPLDKDHETQRSRGLQGLRSILWTVDEGGNGASLGGFTHEQFMRDAFALMTASEQVVLFTSTPSNIPAESSEVYAAALAHVAAGYVEKKPHLIQEADALFLQLQQTNADVTDKEASNTNLQFPLERGMCALLLGEVDDCRTWLGLDDERSPLRDPAVVNFIYSHSVEGEEEDTLPGLCKLLEGWLTDVVFPRFRDTESLRATLGDYYDDRSVLNYLEGLEKVNNSPLAAAAAIVRIGAGAGAAVKATFKRVFPLGRTKDIPSTTVAPDQSAELPKRDFSRFVSHQGTDGEAMASGMVLPGSMDGSSDAAYENWGSSGDSNGGVTANMEAGNVSNLPEEWRLRPIQIAATGVLFGALVMAGLRYLPLHSRVANVLNATTSSVSSLGTRRRDAQELEGPRQ
ncbi:hypothetical protein CY35_17G071200 [Sphagnum magellanicum]|nr:hypothetical protein CY35_17G071200 [Sphagnum magellanicum]KAH9535775.1 hypothetical protein CY35_17G071200 [Sphagnum magellanicum]